MEKKINEKWNEAGNTFTILVTKKTKVADDSQGRWMLEELESSGVDTSFCVVRNITKTAKDGVSHFNYVIVDNQTNTRTCVFTPGYPPLLPDDLTESLLVDVLDRVRVIHVTGRSRETELLLAQKAHSKNVSILINAEKRREGLDKLLDLADYAVCSTHFPQDWTESPSSPSALLSMLIRLPKLKFVIMTLGEDGCVMLERCPNEVPESEETDIDELHESLKQSTDFTSVLPVCNSSMVTRLKGNVTGRLYIVTAEKIPSSELMDTTGAGDAFTGGLLYGNNILYAKCIKPNLTEFVHRHDFKRNADICISSSKFASSVFRLDATSSEFQVGIQLYKLYAACCCRGLGARTTLPFRTDPNLAAFLGA
ncbi:hypothetical protein YC2023_074694 [Brassica napus]